MQEAARLLPSDQRAQYGLAQCLLQLNRLDEADPLLVASIELDPLSEIAELARTDRSRIAQANFRAEAADGIRPDAVFYCLDALKRFRELGESQTKTITFEIAMLGRAGFDINSPDKKYTLKSLPEVIACHYISGSGTFGSGIRTSGSLAVSGSGTFGSGIVFPDADASNWVAFKSASVVPSNVTWTLPSGDAAVSGYALISDASGNLTWGEAGGGGATGGGTDEVFYENDQVVTANYTITTNKNAVTAGVIAINSGIDITIPSGSYWVVV
jgi:hypothetical protein